MVKAQNPGLKMSLMQKYINLRFPENDQISVLLFTQLSVILNIIYSKYKSLTDVSIF
jgi:hypothetical protein